MRGRAKKARERGQTDDPRDKGSLGKSVFGTGLHCIFEQSITLAIGSGKALGYAALHQQIAMGTGKCK